MQILKRMQEKHNSESYTYFECCILIAMMIGTFGSFLAGVVLIVVAFAAQNYGLLLWLLVCLLVGIASAAGLMYVGDYDL